MQTAEKLFTNRRIHEITLDEVARHARVGKGTIYRHFEDKDDLFFQVATSGFDELCDLLRKNVPADAPFADRLLRMSRAINAFFEQRREMFHMMQVEDARIPGCKGRLRKRWLVHRTRLVQAVAKVMSDGMSEGVLREDISSQILAHVLLGMLRARVQVLDQLPDEARRHEVVINMFLNGALRRP